MAAETNRTAGVGETGAVCVYRGAEINNEHCITKIALRKKREKQ